MKNLNAYLLVAVGILQCAAPVLPLLGLGQTVGSQATGAGIPPELPLGIFFSIWSVIFALYLVFALFALLKPSYLERHLGEPLLVAGAGNVAWMLSAQFIGNEVLNFVLLLPILVFSWESAHRLHRMGGWDGTARRLVAGSLTGLLSGWLAVALSISVPRVLRLMRGQEATDQVWVSLFAALIPAAVMAWLYSHRVSRGLWFYVALAWGLTGIVASNWLRTGTEALAIVAACVGLYIIFRRIADGGRPAFR